MGKKVSTCALCALFLIQILGGCAEMSEQQRDALFGAGLGAATGAAVGAAAGGGKGAAIGAATGAAVGAAAGWLVGEYRERQIRSAKEAVAAYAYQPQQGVVVKIGKTAAAPRQLRPGDHITLQTDYTVLVPPERGQVKVREVRTLLFNGQALKTVSQDKVRGTGTHTTQQTMTLPNDAAKGRYTFKTNVHTLDVEKAAATNATTTFVVGP